MMRSLHRWPGVIAAVLVVVLALSGSVLSILPASEALRTAQAHAGLSVAELTERIAAVYPSVEQIRRAPSGRVTAYFFVGDRPEAAVINPATGRASGRPRPRRSSAGSPTCTAPSSWAMRAGSQRRSERRLCLSCL